VRGFAPCEGARAPCKKLAERAAASAFLARERVPGHEGEAA
jgi:hypothetical protein